MNIKKKGSTVSAVMFRQKPTDASGLAWVILLAPVLFFLGYMHLVIQPSRLSVAILLFVAGSALVGGGMYWQIRKWFEDYTLIRGCVRWADKYYSHLAKHPVSDFLHSLCLHLQESPDNLFPGTRLYQYWEENDGENGHAMTALLNQQQLNSYLELILRNAGIYGVSLEGFCGNTIGSVVEVIPENEKTKRFWLWNLLSNNTFQAIMFFVGFFLLLILSVVFL